MADPPAGEEIIIDISSELPAVDWPKCCIYRVPKLLRKVNEEAYTPKLISIGPFHHGGNEFKDMEKYKVGYFKDFLKRTGKSKEELLEIIKVDKEKISHCYSEEQISHCYSNSCILGSDDHFVKMILLDAIFIIELFLKVKKMKEKEEVEGEKKKEEEDYILRKIWLANGIYYDLLLLENQLPFFVLENLYKFAGFNDSKKDVPFVKLFCIYFAYYDQKRKSILEEVIEKLNHEEVIEKLNREKVKHLTDLLRYLFCLPSMEENWESERDKWSFEGKCICSSKNKKRRESGTQYCATKLDDAGLKFKVKDDTCLLDITLPGPCFGRRSKCFSMSCICACFDNCLPICFMCFILFLCLIMQIMQCLLRCFGFPMHIMRVPQLVIDYGTEGIFRNLMALEQCHYPSKTYICNYILLLDRLIDTTKDVNLLVENKVIANHLGSNADVAALINKLGDQIFVPTTLSYFDFITQKLNDHYEFPLNHFFATLKRQYFNNVFRGTTTIVGLIVLGFTLWSFIRSFVV